MRKLFGSFADQPCFSTLLCRIVLGLFSALGFGSGFGLGARHPGPRSLRWWWVQLWCLRLHLPQLWALPLSTFFATDAGSSSSHSSISAAPGRMSYSASSFVAKTAASFGSRAPRLRFSGTGAEEVRSLLLGRYFSGVYHLPPFRMLARR